jgi:hypothetical protein
LSMDAAVWDVTVFTKNRERLLSGDVAARFLAAVVAQAQKRSRWPNHPTPGYKISLRLRKRIEEIFG